MDFRWSVYKEFGEIKQNRIQIRHWSDTLTLDRCLVNVDPWGFACVCCSTCGWKIHRCTYYLHVRFFVRNSQNQYGSDRKPVKCLIVNQLYRLETTSHPSTTVLSSRLLKVTPDEICECFIMLFEHHMFFVKLWTGCLDTSMCLFCF